MKRRWNLMVSTNEHIVWTLPEPLTKNSSLSESSNSISSNEIIVRDFNPLPLPKKKKPIEWKMPKIIPAKDEYYEINLVSLYREPIVTYCITPNNAPEVNHSLRGKRNSFAMQDEFENDIYRNKQASDLLLNTINGLFQRFYAPERIRLNKDGIKVKINDIVSYKIAIENGEMKFYLSVPEKWSKSFISAIKKDWGQVDITKVDERVIDFNPSKTKAMEVHMRHHYALSLKHTKESNDDFLSAISSLASTLDKDDKLLIDYNIEPVNGNWKDKATDKIKQFKNGKVPNRDALLSFNGIVGKVLDMFNVI